MSEAPKRSIPSWQRSEASSETIPPEQEETGDPIEPPVSTASPSENRLILFEDAKRFLDDEAVRNAAPEHKVAFLKSKGVQSEEIQRLLSPDLRGATHEEAPSQSSQSSQPSSNTSATNTSAPSVPPIITYPEFLLHRPKPAPILTAPRVLNTISIFGATTTLIYGASKYLLAPMRDSLTSARHSLFETTISNLDALNEKLESIVSSVPKDPLITIEGDDDASSTASDPTELFHRDIGVQTELPQQSPASDLAASSQLPTSPQNAVESHLDALQSLENQLKETLKLNEDVLDEDTETGTKITELNLYLEGLDRKPAFQVQHGRAVRQGEEQDEIAKVRAEIRGVKGALLSARSFPAGSRGRVAG